ncbi:MAG: hypothetical protein Q7J52_04075, partial [Falsiroseomonas sp.]|nr:hypothetical protein [Falsiroseomonas sp.]
MRLFRTALLGLGLSIFGLLPAQAQMETREGIALQNQILQLRQEVEMLRRGGVTAMPAPMTAPSALGGRPVPPGGAPQTELVGALLDRVARLEEELRSVRGRAEQSEFRERTLQERLEKLEGDVDFRLQQIEGQRQGSATPPARAPAAAAATPPAAPSAAAAPAAAAAAPA